MQMGSAAMLKKQGLTPVDVWYGEAKPHRRPIIDLNDTVQDRRGKILYFAGVATDGSAILGKDEREAKRLQKQVVEDRKHWPPDPRKVASRFLIRHASTNTERDFYKATDGNWYVDNEDYNEDEDGEQIEGDIDSYGPFPSEEAAEKYMRDNFANSGGSSSDKSGRRKPPRKPTSPRGRSRRWAFSGSPLMLQPDYGHGDAAVPGDEEYHPCQHGGPCQCGGQCSCGKQAVAGVAAAYGAKQASPKGIKDLKPNKWYISTEDGDTYGPYPNESKAKSDGKAAFGGSTDYIVEKGGTIGASVLNPRRFGLFTPDELVK